LLADFPAINPDLIARGVLFPGNSHSASGGLLDEIGIGWRNLE
jgi:hypothetical protein